MNENYLTYDEFIALGQKYYDCGGDCIVECWSEKDFANYANEFGGMSKTSAMLMINLYREFENMGSEI